MASLGYARVSTDGQTLDAQVAELKAAGAERIFQEKISGVVTERIQLRRAMKALSPDDVLIVTRLDRLARSTRDLPNTLATVGEIGAGFRSLRDTWADTTTPHGRLMLTILAGLAEFERELIKSRTSEGRERAKSRGVRMGRRPKLTAHQRQEALARREAGEKCRTGVNPDEIVAYYTGGREALEARRAAAKAPARSSTWEKEKSQYSAHLSSNNRQATKTDYEKKLRLPELSRFAGRSVPSITANEIAKAYADIHARSRSTGHAFRRVVKAFWTYLGDATRADETGVTIDLSRLKKIPDPPAEIGDPNTPFNPEDE
jgi:DNA invertase Pin-like site-specific DNA recombinase